MSSTFLLSRRAWSILYVVGALILAVVTTIAFRIPVSDDIELPLILGVVLLLYLGPVGLAAALVIALPLALVFTSSLLLGSVGAVVLATGVAAVNARIVDRWLSRVHARRSPAQEASPAVLTPAPAPRPPQAGAAEVSPAPWQQALGAILFGFAGCAFIILCVVAGFAVFTAHGVDVVAPEAQARRAILFAGLGWWPGLAVAIAGLVLWIRLGRRGAPLLPWAVAALALQIGFYFVIVAGQP